MTKRWIRVWQSSSFFQLKITVTSLNKIKFKLLILSNEIQNNLVVTNFQPQVTTNSVYSITILSRLNTLTGCKYKELAVLTEVLSSEGQNMNQIIQVLSQLAWLIIMILIWLTQLMCTMKKQKKTTITRLWHLTGLKQSQTSYSTSWLFSRRSVLERIRSLATWELGRSKG